MNNRALPSNVHNLIMKKNISVSKCDEFLRNIPAMGKVTELAPRRELSIQAGKDLSEGSTE